MRLHQRDQNTTNFAGVHHLVNLTLTNFVISQGPVRTGIVISGGNEILQALYLFCLNLCVASADRDQRQNQILFGGFGITSELGVNTRPLV